jgi:uncharacterized DUF497 family protein
LESAEDYFASALSGIVHGVHLFVHWIVSIVWDPRKAASNSGKHGVRFADAAMVFEDPRSITLADDESDPAEQRLVTIGFDAAARILVVVYAWRGDDIRLISARRAEPHEREAYEQQ